MSKIGILLAVYFISMFGCAATPKLVSPINGICSSRKPCYENEVARLEVESITCACSPTMVTEVDRRRKRLSYEGECSQEEILAALTPRLITAIDIDGDQIISAKEGADYAAKLFVKLATAGRSHLTGEEFCRELASPK